MKKRMLVLAGLGALAVAGAAWARQGSEQTRIGVDVSYMAYDFPQLATGADAVLLGRVTRISPTLWNQDSGEYWEELKVDQQGLETIYPALPYYEIELALERSLVDAANPGLKPGAPVVFTVVGMSPLDDPHLVAEGDAARSGEGGELGLTEGDRALLFGVRTELAWRQGSRPILQLMGEPSGAYLAVAEDGSLAAGPLAAEAEATSVDALAERILALRAGDNS